VFYADNAEESSLLADVFGYKSNLLDASAKYARMLFIIILLF